MKRTDTLVPHEHILFADFETHWSQEYTLKKLNTSSYVRDPRFRAHMLGVQLDDGTPDVIEHKDIPKYLKSIKWNKTATCFHNSPFDSLILSHHYGVIPAYFYDTLAIARVLHGADMRADLATAADHYNVGNKLEDVLIQSKGIYDLRTVPGLYDKTAVYCGVDVNVMYKMFLKMIAGAKETGLNGRPFPVDELDLIHITTRMFADPLLRMDVKQLKQVRDEEIARKKALFYKALSPAQIAEAKEEMLKDKKAIKEGKNPDNIFDLAKWVLGKDRYFVPMLEAMGVEAPMKWSDKQQKMIYATAKGDLEPVVEDLEAIVDAVQSSGESDEPVAAEDAIALIEAKLATSSNIDITRAERFIALGDKGMPAPMGYNYGAAHTFRWGGANKCLVGTTVITVERQGEVVDIELQDLRPEDYVWDGEHFVEHDGLIYQGMQEVITYGEITGTPTHLVFCEGEDAPRSLAEAAARGVSLAAACAPRRG